VIVRESRGEHRDALVVVGTILPLLARVCIGEEGQLCCVLTGPTQRG